MLIYQITQPNPKKTKILDEGLLDIYKKTKKDRAGRGLLSSASEHNKATKAYNFWNNFKKKYANNFRDKAERARYLNGSSGVMRKQLINFVEINFLNRNHIQSFVNGDDIMVIIDKIMNNQISKYKKSNQNQANPTSPRTKNVLHSSPSGTKLISGEPKIIRYGNRDYMVNSKGEWINAKTQAIAPEELQAFLDKEDDFYSSSVMEDASGTMTKEYKLFVDLIRQASLASQTLNNHTKRSKEREYDKIEGNDEVVNSTGNEEADRLLTKHGFKIS
jgi:hypothetical protein